MSNKSKSGGTGFLGVLTLIFITLKLLKVITWSWVWVLSPMWIPLLIILIILLIIVLAELIKAL